MPQNFPSPTDVTQLILLYPHTVASKGHEHLTHDYLGNTETHNCLQQNIKKMPSLSPWESYHSPITKWLPKQKTDILSKS